jgi:dTDP-4-dehydrorhamnose reductase
MTLLVFGKTGQVARELARQAPDAVYLGRDRADLSDPEACAAAIIRYAPSAIINAAAYTSVDQAETDQPLAQIINGDSPGAMARAAAQLDVPFVHISTDYVFDGTGRAPWTPKDTPVPLGVYGRSKHSGEDAVIDQMIATNGAYAILRTSWVISAHGSNFVKTMLRLGTQRPDLSIVADQVGGPTGARDIATTCLTIADALKVDRAKSGIYHFAGTPDVSWADFAREIFLQADVDCHVTDIASAQYPTPARRPTNSRLDCSGTTQVFGVPRPDWRNALSDILKELSTS